MTDQRPQYGEIATLEEQRRAAGLPPLDAMPVAAESPVVPEAPTTEPRRAGSSPVDRFVTIALLAYGLVNVVVTGLSYLDFSTAMNEVLRAVGADGEFTNFAQGKLWGTIAAVVLAAGWSFTAYFSIRRLRSGRRSWWVPLVGAAVTLFVASICVAIPLMNDPSFIAFMDTMAAR